MALAVVCSNDMFYPFLVLLSVFFYHFIILFIYNFISFFLFVNLFLYRGDGEGVGFCFVTHNLVSFVALPSFC